MIRRRVFCGRIFGIIKDHKAAKGELDCCAVEIPNHEIRQVFERDILTKLRRNVPDMDDITRALLTNNPAALRAEGVAEIVKIGLAYYAKRVELVVG